MGPEGFRAAQSTHRTARHARTEAGNVSDFYVTYYSAFFMIKILVATLVTIR